jgi:hypothetical protein
LFSSARLTARLVHVDGARVLAVGQADEDVVAEPERDGDLLADELAVVRPGQGLDQHRRRPVGGAAVVVHLAARRELGDELADRLAQELVVVPRLHRHVGVGKAALVGEELDDRDLALAVGLEARDVGGHGIGEGQRAALGEEPHRARREHLGVRVEQPERVVLGGRALGIQPRVPQRADERELAAARDGELGARIARLRHVARHQLHQALERRSVEAELGRGRGREGKFHEGLRG